MARRGIEKIDEFKMKAQEVNKSNYDLLQEMLGFAVKQDRVKVMKDYKKIRRLINQLNWEFEKVTENMRKDFGCSFFTDWDEDEK